MQCKRGVNQLEALLLAEQREQICCILRLAYILICLWCTCYTGWLHQPMTIQSSSNLIIIKFAIYLAYIYFYTFGLVLFIHKITLLSVKISLKSWILHSVCFLDAKTDFCICNAHFQQHVAQETDMPQGNVRPFTLCTAAVEMQALIVQCLPISWLGQETEYHRHISSLLIKYRWAIVSDALI